MFMLGAGYVLLIKTHIKVDVITNYFPLRAQYIIDIVIYIVFFFPYLFVMIWWGASLAISMTIAGEISNTSQWLEPIWPWRWLIPVGFFLFLLQAVAEFIRLIKSLKSLRTT
jgi:TRAP-type mannitol/chloroaromatic compound transport system permease small subunit